MAKYNQGYTECVQECINFMNKTGSSARDTVSQQNNDHVIKQRLILNLVKQFQATGGLQTNPLLNKPQIEQYLRQQQQQQQLTSGNQLMLDTLPNRNVDNGENNLQVVSPGSEASGFRRSSCSPISGNSECSSHEGQNYYELNNSSSSSSSTGSLGNGQASPSFDSFTENLNDQNSMPDSPKFLDTTSEKDNCWRPW